MDYYGDEPTPPLGQLGAFLGNVRRAAERLASGPNSAMFGELAALASVIGSHGAEQPITRGTAEGTISQAAPVTLFQVAGVNFDGSDLAGSTQLSTMLVGLDATSGAGRYLVGGDMPTALHGIEFPAGGGRFVVRDTMNIQTFALIATTATPLRFAVQVFARPSAGRAWPSP